ncbi:MAG: DUF2461 domain-containing protein [Acidobacteriota bacterium]|jgi:uncharacterized protein (TIGR02453 family)
MQPHFTPDLFRFLDQLRRNNRRDWFERHKERYLEHVREPMLRFIADFRPRLERISRHLVADPRPVGGSMFRVHRDVRFSKDKSPYKPYAAAQFRHRRGKDVHAPGYYVHLAPDSIFAGAGIWHPERAVLDRIRNALVERPEAWRRLLRRKPFRDGTLALGGDALKRPPRGFDPEHPLVEDLKRKDFITTMTFTVEDACSPDFLSRYAASCRAAAPFLRFLAEALDLEF